MTEDDSKRRGGGRRGRRRRSGGARKPGGSRSGRRRSGGSKSMTSSFSRPVPSRAPIELPEKPKDPAVFRAFLFGFLAVAGLILLGGSHHAFALGFALAAPGFVLLRSPPLESPGRWMDIGAGGLLAVFLGAFLPVGGLLGQNWREEAVDAFGIDLPGLATIQPALTGEAFLLAAAGLSWFYLAANWRINHNGWQWLYFCLSCLIAVFAGTVVYGNVYGLRYPGAEDATAFSFFPNRNQTANFLAVGGVVTFGYAMEGLRNRRLLHLIGLVATGLCFAALVLGVARAGLFLYFAGLFLWFLIRLRDARISRFLKVGLPGVLLLFVWVLLGNTATMDRTKDFLGNPGEWEREYRALLYRDTAHMVGDAPLTGHGLGNFSAIFPQYREAARNHHKVAHPESDVFWLAAEGGAAALVFAGILLAGFFRKYPGSRTGRSGPYREIAWLGVVVFLLHALVDVPAHRPGTAYFAILFAGLAVSRGTGKRTTLPPWAWRTVGGGLVVFGLLWMGAGLFGWKTQSNKALERDGERVEDFIGAGDYGMAREVIGELLGRRPLDWRMYTRRAQLTLAESGDPSAAAEDFRRARFVEPVLGAVTLEETLSWLPDAPGRAVSAWRKTLSRELANPEKEYLRMIRKGHENEAFLVRLIELSRTYPEFRTELLLTLEGDRLMKEIERELENDPALGHLERRQRSRLVAHWIDNGDVASAESFLEEQGAELAGSWWLRSRLLQKQARFEEALSHLREHIRKPDLPELEITEKQLVRFERKFERAARDLRLGTALLQYHLEQKNYDEALKMADALLERDPPPAYAHYWRAEVLYQLADYIESWYAYETFIEQTGGVFSGQEVETETESTAGAAEK